MLCDSCHQREATCHVTHIIGEKMQRRDFCQECFEAAPDARAMVFADRDARCMYCGGQPCVGTSGLLDQTTGVLKAKYMCIPCATEYGRYIGEQSAPFASQLGFPVPGTQPDEDVSAGQAASALSHQEQVALLKKISEAADKHMKEWLAKRGQRPT